MSTTTYTTINLARLSRTFQAWQNCVKSKNIDWIENHMTAMEEMLEALPHGSGIDQGVKFDFEKSTVDKLIFRLSFHHMNDHGYYDGWTDHTIRVNPTFGGFKIYIGGVDKNQIKEYLSQLFNELFIIQ